ncbi:MAG: hypothetical protein MJZ54_02630 [Bacteroidaceae bacterium]|nr:hypothetical protein [Bacteroidaceae bacterium]
MKKSYLLMVAIAAASLSSCNKTAQNESGVDSLSTDSVTSEEAVSSDSISADKESVEEETSAEGIFGTVKLSCKYDTHSDWTTYRHTEIITLNPDGTLEIEEEVKVKSDTRSEFDESRTQHYKYSGGWETDIAQRGSRWVHTYRLSFSDNYGDYTYCINEKLTYIYMGKNCYADCDNNRISNARELEFVSGKENFKEF